MVTTSSLLRFLSSTGYILFAPDRSYVPVTGDAATASCWPRSHRARHPSVSFAAEDGCEPEKHKTSRMAAHTSLVNEKTHPPIKILSQKRN